MSIVRHLSRDPSPALGRISQHVGGDEVGVSGVGTRHTRGQQLNSRDQPASLLGFRSVCQSAWLIGPSGWLIGPAASLLGLYRPIWNHTISIR